MRNTEANIVKATHDGKVGCNIQHLMTGPGGNCEFCSQAYFCQIRLACDQAPCEDGKKFGEHEAEEFATVS